ncbi:MAG TPA: hypothetical protein VF980_12600 [Thermoanaerobaculia bacterium]
MNGHFDEEMMGRVADGEEPDNAHVRECARCANGVVEALRLKRAVRDAVPRVEVPESLRRRVTRSPQRNATPWWLAAAAMLVIAVTIGANGVAMRRDATRELVDLHSTIVGSANPIDVLSTDRHTVKPWFEGRVPFAVDVPDLNGTPFRLTGGRVVFWRGQPGAYLLLTKGAHRVSLFIFRDEVAPRVGTFDSMRVVSWRANGLAYVAVGDLPREELESLRSAFAPR